MPPTRRKVSDPAWAIKPIKVAKRNTKKPIQAAYEKKREVVRPNPMSAAEKRNSIRGGWVNSSP
jgi:hypothetical protein